jgi:hypothetical protein
LNADPVIALAIDPETSTTLYAGINNKGIFKSSDSGENWKALDTGPVASYFSALAIDPLNPNTIYTGTGDGVFVLKQ